MVTDSSANIPLLLTLPARTEWGWVARRVFLAYAHSLGMSSVRLEELGVIIGRMWDEVALSPGVVEATISLSAAEGVLSLILEGNREPTNGESYPEGQQKEWSSRLTAALITHLTQQASITHTDDRLLIEASFAREPAG